VFLLPDGFSATFQSNISFLAKNEELLMEKSEFDIQVKNEAVDEDSLEDEDSNAVLQPHEVWFKVEDTDITDDYSIR